MIAEEISDNQLHQNVLSCQLGVRGEISETIKTDISIT